MIRGSFFVSSNEVWRESFGQILNWRGSASSKHRTSMESLREIEDQGNCGNERDWTASSRKFGYDVLRTLSTTWNEEKESRQERMLKLQRGLKGC